MRSNTWDGTSVRTNVARGFSLIELLIAVVIVAVLAAVAVPSYQSHVRDGRRAAAQADLSDISSRQEQFYLNNRTYTLTISASGLNAQTVSDGGFYAYSVDEPTGGCPITQCYVLRAVPQGSQGNDACGAMTVDSSDERLPANCW